MVTRDTSPILAEVVNINKLYHSGQISSPTIRDSFRKKYARGRSREIEVNVYDLIKPAPNYQRPKLPDPGDSPSFFRSSTRGFKEEIREEDGSTIKVREYTEEAREVRRESAFAGDDQGEDYIFKPPEKEGTGDDKREVFSFTKEGTEDDNKQGEDRDKIDPLEDFNFEQYAESKRPPPPVAPRVKKRSISSSSQTMSLDQDPLQSEDQIVPVNRTRKTTTSSQTEAEVDSIIMSLFNDIKEEDDEISEDDDDDDGSDTQEKREGEDMGTQAGELFGEDAGTQVLKIVQHDSETQSLDTVKHDTETQVVPTPQRSMETQYEEEKEKLKSSDSSNQTFDALLETGTSACQTDLPDIVLVPPIETGEPEIKILNNNLNKNLKTKNKPAKLEMNLFDTKAAEQQQKQNKLMNLVNSIQAQYGDKIKAEKDAAQKSATEIKESTSMIDNLHAQYFSEKSEPGASGKNNKISEMFNDDKKSKLKNDNFKREFRRTDVKSKVGKMKDKLSEEELLESLMKEVAKLPMYKAAEFEKSFVKNITDREFTELLKHRLKDKGSELVTDVLKDMVCRIDADDMYELTEQYMNEKRYGEGSKIAMKVCENFLNKRDISEFIKRNYQYMSVENKKALATNAMEDLPYDAMRSVLELQMGKLKEKDIPNVLNSINATPNRKELEKSITILSSKLTGEESQKVIKALGKGMKNDDVTRTIKQLFDYLPKTSSEALALKYVPKTKVLVEKWTETKAVEVKKMSEKRCGTETILETTHVQKVTRTEGKLWFSKDKKSMTKSTQTDEFNKLLMTKNKMKNKMDLYTAAQAVMRARKRMAESNLMDKKQTAEKKEERKLIKFDSMVETDGGQVVVKRAELNEKIKTLEDEKDRIFNEYSWTAQLLQEAEDELQDYKDSYERKEIALEEARREAEYNMNDLNIARQEIDVLENELADVRAALFNERQRKSNINRKGNFNVDRLHRELEKMQDQEQELSMIQEDFLDMERKWLQEQKHREYYEESSTKAEAKAKELSTQLYMLITNELTPEALKEQLKRENPAETKDIPHLSPGQLSALLTVFVAGGVLPTTKVPDTATIFTKEELKKASTLTPDSGPDAPPAPPAPIAPSAPKAPPPPKGAPPAPPPPNAPPLAPGAPPAPPPPNAPPISGAPAAPRPPNAPPLPGTGDTAAPKVGPVVDERLIQAEQPAKAPDGPANYVPRGRLEDLKSRRRDRSKKANLPKKKIIPEPSRQLKVFNWTKLPEAKAANSIWKDMDESQILRMLDLDEIDDLFQARKIVKKDLEEGGQKKKNISVIDPKKAQNCTILLSKIKKTNEELVDLIITCDKGDLLHVDMLEMLMKYTPTAEEKDSLNQVAEDEDMVAALARADRFMLDVSKIYHYDERLKSLYFRRKFEERFNFIRPKIRCLINASNEVYKSHKLRELLQLLLGFGNYFNYGKRGNAMGFKLETLTKLIDTKANSDTKFTLMHYVAETIETQFPDIHDFMDDVLHVPLAAKVGLGDLKTDVNDFQSSFRALVKECDHMSKNPQIKGARHFANMFEVFIKEAEPKMQEIEGDMGEMKKKYLIATQHFAEPSSVEPEAFFGNFNTFFMHYNDAKEELARKKEEEELKKNREEKQKLKLSDTLSLPNSSENNSPGRLSPCQSPQLGERRTELTDVEKLEVEDHDMMLGMLGVRGASPKPAAGDDDDFFDGTLSQISAGGTGRRRKKRTTKVTTQRERSSYDTL